MASYKTERLAQEFFKNPAVVERFKTDRDGLFDEYSVPEHEREALREGTPQALARIQLHPILCIHFLMGTDPGVQRMLSGEIVNWLEETPHG